MTMDPIRAMYKDEVTLVKADGRRFPDIAAGVHGDSITLLDEGDMPVEEGDVVLRQLPSGLTEEYQILESVYYSGTEIFPSTYKCSVQKSTSRRPRGGLEGYTIFNVSGPGARVNIDSNDLSHNVTTVTPTELFREIREALKAQVADESDRARLLERVEALEAAQGTRAFGSLYVQFMSVLADHVGLAAVLAPHLPALAQMVVR